MTNLMTYLFLLLIVLNLFQLSASAGGMTSGAVLGIFILGLFFPCANAKVKYFLNI